MTKKNARIKPNKKEEKPCVQRVKYPTPVRKKKKKEKQTKRRNKSARYYLVWLKKNE